MKKIVSMLLMMVLAISVLTGCSDTDKARQLEVAANLEEAQQTPTDIDYSLERYNLIRRAYWVNGQREKALALPCSIEKPLGYVILITDNGAILGNFVVDGKVSSLNSFLTPDTTYPNSTGANWLADVDGSYGENFSLLLTENTLSGQEHICILIFRLKQNNLFLKLAINHLAVIGNSHMEIIYVAVFISIYFYVNIQYNKSSMAVAILYIFLFAH